MPGDPASLVYLVLLLVFLVSSLVVRSRRELGKTLQNAVTWVLIFLAAIVAVGLWQDIRSTVIPQQAVLQEGTAIAIPRRPDGHYHATLEVNGVDIPFVVDTGASGIVLTLRDAEKAGIDTAGLVFTGEAMTANGPVRTAFVRLDTVRLGPFEDRGLVALVNAGEMDRSLLGMSYLQRFAHLEIANGRLILRR